jgi:hypothetical protein
VQRAQSGFCLLVSVAFLRIRICFVAAKRRTAKHAHILRSKFLLGVLAIAPCYRQVMIVVLLLCGNIEFILKQRLLIGWWHLVTAIL